MAQDDLTGKRAHGEDCSLPASGGPQLFSAKYGRSLTFEFAKQASGGPFVVSHCEHKAFINESTHGQRFWRIDE